MENRFNLGHGERSCEEMLAHFKDDNDIVGDHPLNLLSASLALNAYMATGDDESQRADAPSFTVVLEPGCGARITAKMMRYANQPAMQFPW